MAIRDIFKMIKADRYTSDGREELIKAQEAITEDIRYKPGDISKATGLQKQPDGSWKPVKNAPAQSKKSDKTTPEEMSKIKTLSAQYKNAKTDAEKDRIANEVNKIMGVEERMKAEQSASGSLREQTPAIRNKEESITVNEADKFYEGFGLKKTGEHVDSKGWTVKEYKNEAGETWRGKFNKEGKYVGSDYEPSSGSGVPTQGSDWMSLPSGTRMTFEGAKEKMAKNNERIETIKKMMEGKSRADNFRLGSELKSLQNENEYIAERLPPEKTDSPSASGSDYNKAHAQLTQLKASAPELQNDFDAHRDIILKRVERGQPLNEAINTYEKEMKLSVPRMVEKNIMSEEEGRQYLRAWDDFKKQTTAGSAPSTPQSTIIGNLSSEDKNKIYQLFNDADFKRQLDSKLEFGLDDKVGEMILKKMPHGALQSKIYDLSRDYNRENFKDARDYKSGLAEAAMGQLYKDYKKSQASDSAPRILTGDCKVRIKKSK